MKTCTSPSIRVSVGTAVVLGLSEGKLDAAPTTAYLMTHSPTKCTANCGFCPQARESRGRADMLSRVSWPPFPAKTVVQRIKVAYLNSKIERTCIQVINSPEAIESIIPLARAMTSQSTVPLSISCQPANNENMRALVEAGVERMGIPLDAASEEVFEKVKGRLSGSPYQWKEQIELLKKAVRLFGKDKVTTHLIVGLGETDREMVNTIQMCCDLNVLPALFAFTPIQGTAMETLCQPSVERYRRIQMARHLIVHDMVRADGMIFGDGGELLGFGANDEDLTEAVGSGEPFLTTGCPSCNRPYYNEKPSGPVYNYPLKLTARQKREALSQLKVKTGL